MTYCCKDTASFFVCGKFERCVNLIYGIVVHQNKICCIMDS